MEAMKEPTDAGLTVKSISDIVSHDTYFYTKTFPLSAGYPLIGFEHLLLALGLYGIMVLWGHYRMTNNKAPLIQDGRWALQLYNFCQVILSAVIAYLATITYGRKIATTGFVCQPMRVDIDSNLEEYQLETFTCWLFYISKWVDYADTFFIIARGKWRQFSFLHLFHHSSMIALTWVAAHYHPCGYFLIAAQLNAPVHFVMYFYYLLSSFPSLAPFLWWKNYITSIQLIQFVTGIIATVYCFLAQLTGYNTGGLSLSFTFAFIIYGITLYLLFSSFYKATYKTRASNNTKSKKDN